MLPQDMVHIAESTVGRRYAGWFIKNTERSHKVLDDLKNMPLPPPTKPSASVSQPFATADASNHNRPARGASGQKVAWGGVKVAS
jgi:translation initiation factor 3 subunit L